VVAADALDGHHRTGGERALGGRQRGIRTVDASVRRPEPQGRPAFGAGDRLRVEAPVCRVVVFGGAARTHGEPGHGGGRAVIGELADDRESRPAVGAGDEGVAVAPVAWVEEFGDAVVAGGDVGRNRRRLAGNGPAGHDPEPASAAGVGGELADRDAADPRQRRRLGAQAPAEFGYACGLALHFDEYGARSVADEAGQPEFGRDAVDEGPEANPLHDTGHGEALPNPDIRASAP
jgi:hypothetical protein